MLLQGSNLLTTVRQWFLGSGSGILGAAKTHTYMSKLCIDTQVHRSTKLPLTRVTDESELSREWTHLSKVSFHESLVITKNTVFRVLCP